MKTPGKVRAALCHPGTHVCGVILLDATAAHWLALEDIASPILDRARPTRLLDYAEAIVLLSRPGKQAMDMVATARDEIRAEAIAICARVSAAELRRGAGDIVALLNRCMTLEPVAPATTPAPAKEGGVADPSPQARQD